MNTFDDLTDQTFHSVIGRTVVDERGDNIGTLDALWTDEETGKVEFIGVKTGWIFGKTHVVPARSVEIHDDQDHIRVPYEAQFVKDAPSYAANEELSDTQEREIYEYYGETAAGGVTTVGTTAGTGASVRHSTGDLRTTDETVPLTGAAAVGGLTGTERDYRATGERGESIENPVVERGPAGAREPIGESTVSGSRTDALPGDRGLVEERHELAAEDVAAARTARPATGDVELTTEEERLKVGTREVGSGRVRLRKVVRTEQVNVPVELRQEDVVVERVPADQVRTGERSDFTGREVEVELRREEPVIEKERVVTGAVRARKTENLQRETVSDTVRKEDVEVDRAGVETETTRTGGTVTGTTASGASAGATESELERQREREREHPDV